MASTKHTRARAEIALPEGVELIWMIIQKIDRQGTWTVADVAAFSALTEKTVREYVQRLVHAGFVGPAGDRRPMTTMSAGLFQITKPSITAPRISKDGKLLPERLTETLWRTMRMLKAFTVEELAGYADTPERPANVGSVRAYVCLLVSAGVISREGKSKGRPQRLRLVKLLGPRAPRILRAQVVYDPNAKTTIGVAESREAVQ